MTHTPIRPSISRHELLEIDRANASATQPVIFIHGLWLLADSWERWANRFEEAGYAPLRPRWPNDPPTTAEANDDPEAMAKNSIGRVVEHLTQVVARLERRPVLVGHSFGGLIAEILAARGLSAATVAIAPAAFRGVLPLPFSALRSASPVLANPLNAHRAVPLTYDQFRYAFANALSDEEAQSLYQTYAVPAPGEPLFQAAIANLNPWSEAKVDTMAPLRRPLLIISGERDHTVPPVVAEAAYKLQLRNDSVTEYREMTNRGHSLTIDDGWPEIADVALAFIRRFAK